MPLIAVLAVGSALALCVCLSVSTGRHPALRLGRCLAGFAVSIFWIMALADEVVNTLTVMAELLGLSDAIVGLTVFAIGNSTADLVADLSIATFSPIMAFSACFGGPMLNILLGIGLSGAYVTLTTGRAYPIEISSSLVTSEISLLTVLAITFGASPRRSPLTSPLADLLLPR
jgi:sodium/potassium/calcium exchanger 6